MIRFLLFSMGSFMALIGFTQSSDSCVVSVTVYSKTEGETVQNVQMTIVSDGNVSYGKSNIKGRFNFLAPRGSNIELLLSHAQFASSSEEFKVPRVGQDTVFIDLEMEFLRSKELDEIVILPPGIPDTVYESKRLHVADFELMNNGKILLLAYPKRLKKGSELIVYDGIRELINFKVPEKAIELIHDFRGNPHVVSEEFVFGIQNKNGRIQLSQLPKDYYMTYVAPIVDTNLSRMYFSNFNPDYPAFDYFTFDSLDSTYKKIMQVQDDLMMELYRSEYKWVDVRTQLWAKQLEYETGIDAEIYVGANYFTQSIYYKEVYAPLFHRNDSLFLFDYYKDKLFTFDQYGTLLDSVEIYHHYNPRSTGWKKELIQDEATGQIYALFDRAGYTYLGRIDTKTGEITEQVKLEYRYVDKVAVQDNFVYYIYREFESIDKRMLWREQLPYSFRKSQVAPEDNVEE